MQKEKELDLDRQAKLIEMEKKLDLIIKLLNEIRIKEVKKVKK